MMIDILDLIPEKLINERIIHVKPNIGEGTIIDIKDSYIFVKYDKEDEIKRLQYPIAIGKFINLVDENKYLKKINDSRIEILKEKLRKKGIEYFVHFTNVENLQQIFEKGILSRKQLREKSLDYKYNDPDRFDGHNDSISISVTMQNYQMMYSLKNRPENKDKKWCVILLDAYKVIELDCAFFAQNAASGCYKNRKWESFSSTEAFDCMFDEEMAKAMGMQRTKGLEDKYTTNPQAEIMVKNAIPVEMIKKVCFDSMSVCEYYYNKLMEITNVPFVVNSYYFKYRSDASLWRKESNYG